MSEATPTITPELLNAEQSATLCGLSRRAWFSFNSAGRIGPKPVRLGRAVRWRRAELLDWISAGCPSRVRWLGGER